MEAASEAVAEHGLHASSVEDIARRADVAVGSIYVHYGSKDGLFRAVIDDAASAAEAQLLQGRAPGRSPLDRLADLGDAYVEFALAEPTAFRLLLLQLLDRPGSADPADATALMRSPVQKVLAHLTHDIRAAIAAGQLPAIPPRLAATFLWGSWTGVLALTLERGAVGANPNEVRSTMQVATAMLTHGASTAYVNCDGGAAAA